MSPATVFERNPTLKQPPGRPGWAEAFAPQLDELRTALRGRDPAEIAARSGAIWDAGAATLRLPLLGNECLLRWPELVACGPDQTTPLPSDMQGLLLYYLNLADGGPPAARWISFRELPDGWLYHLAFQGYTGDQLARALGESAAPFEKAATLLGGKRLDLADSAYAIPCLPRINVAVLCWLGDDEFEPRAQLLFGANAGAYLTTDGLAVLGSLLVRRLLSLIREGEPLA